jgi:hypothetical protein
MALFGMAPSLPGGYGGPERDTGKCRTRTSAARDGPDRHRQAVLISHSSFWVALQAGDAARSDRLDTADRHVERRCDLLVAGVVVDQGHQPALAVG